MYCSRCSTGYCYFPQKSTPCSQKMFLIQCIKYLLGKDNNELMELNLLNWTENNDCILIKDLVYGIVLYLIIWQLNLHPSMIFLFIHPFAFRPQCYYDYIIMFSCYLNSITFKVILCKVTSKYVHQKMTWHSYIRRKCHTW